MNESLHGTVLDLLLLLLMWVTENVNVQKFDLKGMHTLARQATLTKCICPPLSIEIDFQRNFFFILI